MGYTKEQLAELEGKFGTSEIRYLNLRIKDPERFKCSMFHYYYELFLSFQRGILPFRGALTEQPNKIIEIFNILQNLEAERAEKKQREQDRKNNVKR